MKKCCYCDNTAKWLLMSGNDPEKDFYCDKCVPKGCSCNNYDFDRDEDPVPREEQINFFLKDPIKVRNYGNIIHNYGEHLEEITDIHLIKSMFYNFTDTQLLQLEIIPIDKNGEEYPCCEFHNSENGFEDDTE